ncbi:MAG: phosphate ABC transporter ATP-binding protein [Anaerolineae bacterium]|nr:phosphate ABC transporter ATP-binding protein [Anaerolineae bacterium]
MSEILYQFTSVRQTYGARTVLDIPSLAIRRDEILALIGPSGAGKSTLLRLLALLEPPTQGAICAHVDGRAVTCAQASIIDRRKIAMVFQRPALLSRSVRANIAYGLRLRGQHKTPSVIDDVLRRVALLPLAQAHPRTLSGGETQRVALARALVLQPSVLLLDEPTANLDPANGRLIEDLVREQHQQYGTAIILATHNLFQARRLATRVGFLMDGKLVEIAPTETLFTSPHDSRTTAFISGETVY